MELMKIKFKQTEVGLIPEDWNIKSTIDCAKNGEAGIKIGPFGSALKKDLLVRQGYKVYGQENVFDRDVEIGDRFITLQHFRKLKSCELLPGDFIVSMMGTIGQCMILPEKMEQGIMDSHLLRIKLDKSVVHPDFFEHVFSSPIALNQVKKLSVGGIMEGLSSKIVKKIQYPLPPTLTEQKAIATALSDVDALISKLEKLIVKKKAIKQGAMQELLTPPQNGGKRLPGFSGEWEETVFTKICDLVHGHQFRTEDFNHNTEGIKVVKIGNVFHNFLKTYDCDTIANNRLEEFQKYLINKGDILMSLTGNIGRVVRVKNVYEPMLQNYRVGKFVPRDWVDGEFLAVILGSIKTTTQLEQLSNSGAQANFGKQDFDKVKVQIPNDIEEQKAIAQILSDMDLEIEALEAKKAKYLGIKQGMMQELLTGKTRLI